MTSRNQILIGSALGLLVSMSVRGGTPVQQTSSVLDGSGGSSSGGGYTHLSAGGQPGGISESFNGGIVNQAGFLQTFFMNQGLDTDGDGIPDEADLDNDGDDLRDAVEIAGSSFDPTTPTDPNTRDSDGDGIPDNQESVAGTDPTDSNAHLEITSITNSAGDRFVHWVARSNKTYRLLRTDNGVLPPTNVIAVAPANGPAAPPWYVLTNSIADVFAPTNASIYAVEVLP